jgi:hypothetical protein
MGRIVKARASYLSDAQYLIRLSQSVEKDTRHTPEWRREVLQALQILTAIFIKDSSTEKAL